jgi:hypothetical protein
MTGPRTASDPVPPHGRPQPRDVPGSTEPFVHPIGPGERHPRGATVPVVGEAECGRFQRFRLRQGPPGLGEPVRGDQEQRRAPVEHAPAVGRAPLSVRHLPSSGESRRPGDDIGENVGGTSVRRQPRGLR